MRESEMKNPVIYVFVNKGLHMTTGKVAAQVTHATMRSAIMSAKERLDQWDISIHKTVIVLEARDEIHMRSISRYMFERGFRFHEIIDEGVNEIDPHTVTAAASDILDKDDELVIQAFSTFNLYRDTVKINLEFER